MEIGTFAASPAVSVPKLVQARFASGRVTMPVRPSQYMYARFKNVAGVPAPSDGGGFSLSRLRSIDVLIDRLKQIKGDRAADDIPRALDVKDDAALDAMIEQLSGKLHNAVLAAAHAPYAGASAGSFEGLMVDFSL